MSERVNGLDHPSTITEYTHLALYCFANYQVSVSLKLLYRARYLLLLSCGEQHPEVALLDANIGLVLHSQQQYARAAQFLESSLNLNLKFFGEKTMKVALSHQLLARTLACLGDFRGALRHEKETFATYTAELGPQHDKTRDSDARLRHLTQQAVVMARRMNQAYSSGALPPLSVSPAPHAAVLELLNLVNGILFVHISPAEVERVRCELEKDKQPGGVLDTLSQQLCEGLAVEDNRHVEAASS